MGIFFRYLFVGALALIPLFVVVQLIFWVQALSVDLFEYVSSYTNNTIFTLGVIIFTFIFLALIGSSIEKAGKSYLVNIIDKALEKVPAIGTVYGIVKKITALFKPSKNEDKKEVVLVEYPKDDLWVPAYVLSKHEDILVLFVPTSPNPTSGYTVIVHRDKIKSTTLTVAEASQFIVSMGADFIKKEEISAIIVDSIEKETKKI
jgi:uncharacterized membrane protein